MNNQQKAELRQIIKNIPIKEYSKPIKELWDEYGYYYTYGTFKRYFKIFKIEENVSN